MIWNREAECAPLMERQTDQLGKLQRQVRRVYETVPFYRRRMEEAGVAPGDIKNLADIAKLPFTTKDDLRETYPYGLLRAPEEEIVEIHMSSGTTGTPVVGAYTRKDVDDWAEVMARCLAMADLKPGDTIQNAYGYGLFTGGFGVHYGARRIGANVIPTSSGNTKRQLMVMRDFGSHVITCTPSYALYLYEVGREMGLDFSRMPVKAGLFGAEPWSGNMRREIEKKLSLSAHDIYGLTEIVGPGVACECEAKEGLHIQEDFFYPEIIDPATGKVLPEGEKGELVFTTLTKEGTPILRYRTRDLTWIYREACACGRNTIKMHRLLGRTDDMLVLRGVNVFPSQIENVLLRIEGTEPHFVIVVDRGESHLDSVEVQVEVEPSFFSDETRKLERLQGRIEEEIQNELGIGVRIKLVEPKTIERSIGKAKRVIDKRTL